MTPNGRLIAKCAFAAAVVTGLIAAAQFSERKTVASWAPNAKLESAKPAQAVVAAPARITEQRLAAPARSCAAEVWPSSSKDCIAGRIEPERKEARAVAQPQPQLAAVPAAPAARSSTAPEPATTGSLAAVAVAPAMPSVEPAVQAVPSAPRPREAQRPRSRPAPRAAAQRPAPSSSDRVREPIHFRLAEGRN